MHDHPATGPCPVCAANRPRAVMVTAPTYLPRRTKATPGAETVFTILIITALIVPVATLAAMVVR